MNFCIHFVRTMLKYLVVLMLFTSSILYSQKMLIPMDLSQTDHLKAYGVAYNALARDIRVDWLLNFRGGSFMMDYDELLASECRLKNVFFTQISGSEAASIYAEVQSESSNMDVARLEKQPKIAVYSPPGSLPWDDAVTLAMKYAEVPYEKVWDEEVEAGKLKDYDWLHLHHEDFTGQYGKFYVQFANAPWYIQQVNLLETTAKKLGYQKVSEMKKSVVEKIRNFIADGGFMFAMCTATDTYDIALATAGVDICDQIFDGDPADPAANAKLQYNRTFAFDNFKVYLDPYNNEFSDIDVGPTTINNPSIDYFTLFDFSAKYDPVPTMLTQCHTNVVRGFLGQTTAFKRELLKKSVIALAEREGTNEVKYITGNFGRGTFTWYGGHDPEDYQHQIGEDPTDLALHKNSPGYRLILNNILFPAAKKKKQKT